MKKDTAVKNIPVTIYTIYTNTKLSQYILTDLRKTFYIYI